MTRPREMLYRKLTKSGTVGKNGKEKEIELSVPFIRKTLTSEKLQF